MKALAVAALLLCLLIAGAAACTHSCKSLTVKDVPGCSLKGKGCKCLFHSKYRVELTDPVSGAHGDSGYIRGKTTAGQTAVYQVLLNDRGCNCQAQNIPLGNCTVKAQGCFYFPTLAALQGKKAGARLYVQVLNPKASPEYSAAVPDASQANVANAAMQLLGKIAAFNPACSPMAASHLEQAAGQLNLLAQAPELSDLTAFVDDEVRLN